MKDNRPVQEEELELDLKRLLRRFWKEKWWILLTAVLCAGLVFLGTWLLVTPQYQSRAVFYVNNNAKTDAGGAITTADISASKYLVNSYIVILETDITLNQIIETAEVDRTVEELLEMMEASAVNSTEFFQVVVTSESPREAARIAQAITQVLPRRIGQVMGTSSANAVDNVKEATKPSSPDYLQNTLIGLILGLVLSMAVAVIREMMDVTVHSEEDIINKFSLPILASVPDMEMPVKGGRRSRKAGAISPCRSTAQVGAGVSFAVAEAYKLLRTKIQFSFADENDCHVIGVSSSMAGEGKSTSSVNLAYNLAQLNNRVLLMDCDLRRPSIPMKLKVEKIPGLTNFLTRRVPVEDIIQHCALDDVSFDVLACGSMPPNPIELLSSKRMERLVQELRGSYDYIIMDLPPVGEVSDALVVAKMTDGMLLVVRENYCSRRLLEDTVRQFEFMDAKLLGIQITCATENTKGLTKQYYKQYYRQYETPDNRG